MSELRKCPFCGGEAAVFTYNNEEYDVKCCNPYCLAKSSCWDTEAEAIAAWNTRHVETCENVGFYVDSTRFECSACGYNGWTKWASDGRDKVPNYCPNCGRKVGR